MENTPITNVIYVLDTLKRKIERYDDKFKATYDQKLYSVNGLDENGNYACLRVYTDMNTNQYVITYTAKALNIVLLFVCIGIFLSGLFESNK